MSVPPSKADRRACRTKTRWGSEAAARWALAAIRAGSDNRMRPEVRPYRCRACRKWHLGGGA